MTRIAHITDVHFGAEDPAVVAGLIADLNADAPDLVALSGDLTMGARNSEFAAARAFIDAIHAPVLAVPGNHDLSPYHLWQRFTDPYRRWHRWIAPDTEPAWQDGCVSVVGLNTARRIGWNIDWSRGRVTHARLRKLLARLEAAPKDRVRIVVAHHPLLPPEDAPDTPVAGGAEMTLRALEAAHVSLVLAGHLHRGYSRLTTPDVAALLILQGATATSVRLRGEPNAYNRITIGPDRTVAVKVRIWTQTGWATRAELARDTDPATLRADTEHITSIA